MRSWPRVPSAAPCSLKIPRSTSRSVTLFSVLFQSLPVSLFLLFVFFPLETLFSCLALAFSLFNVSFVAKCLLVFHVVLFFLFFFSCLGS